MELSHIQRMVLILGALVGYLSLILISVGIMIWRSPLNVRDYDLEVFLNLHHHRDIRNFLYVLIFITFLLSCAGIFFSILCTTKKSTQIIPIIIKPWWSICSLNLVLNAYFIGKAIGDRFTMSTDVRLLLGKKLERYGADDTVSTAIDTLQRKYRCCGVESYHDWHYIVWKSDSYLKRLFDENYKWMNGIPGLVREAPISCCDRQQSIICITDALIRYRYDLSPPYFKAGCRERIVMSHYRKLVTNDLPLFCIIFSIHFVILAVIRLYQTSLADAFRRQNPHGPGEASLITGYRTDFLKCMLYMRPVLAKPAMSESSYLSLKRQWIEKRARIGRIVGDVTFLKTIRHRPISTIDRFLRYNFRFLEILFFQDNVPYYINFLRTILRAIIGGSISLFFTFIYFRRMRTNDQVAFLIDGVVFSLAIAFMYVFVVATEFRAVCSLMIPTMFLSIGRSCMLAFIIFFLVTGPIRSITHNFSETFKMTRCTLNLALNQSFDIDEVLRNPYKMFYARYMLAVAEAQATLDQYKKVVDNITRTIDEARDETEKMKAKKACGGSKHIHKFRVLKSLDYVRLKEKKVRARAAKKMKIQYDRTKAKAKEKLSKIEMEVYKSYFAANTSFIASRLRERINTACILLRTMKFTICVETVEAVKQECIKKLRSIIIIGGILQHLCKILNFLDDVCPRKGIEKKLALKCMADDKNLKLLDAWSSKYVSLKNAVNSIGGGFDVGIMWEYLIPRFNIASQPDRLLQSTIYLAGKIQSHVSFFAHSISVISKLLLLVATLLIMKANSYLKKYLTDDRFDNIYITIYFEEVDERRKKEKRQHLLPLRRFEMKGLVWNSLRPTEDELRKTLVSVVKLVILIILCLTAFAMDSMCYNMLATMVDYGKMSDSESFSGTLLTKTYGNGIAAKFMKAHMKQMDNLKPDIKSQPCEAVAMLTGSFIKYSIGFTLGFFFISIVLQPYFSRSQNYICAFFFPNIERRRIVKLYNMLLLKRRKQLTVIKGKVERKLQEGAKKIEYNLPFGIRENFPLLAKLLGPLLKLFGAKHICIVCDIKEMKDFYICPTDGTAYCKVCFEDCQKTCLTCSMSEGTSYADHGLQQSSNSDDNTDDERRQKAPYHPGPAYAEALSRKPT